MIYYFYYPKNETTGANLYYSYISQLLDKTKGSKPIRNFWSFTKLGIKQLQDNDVLITNVGSYAYIFHYLRQMLNKRFRIVRDVQATLHSSYIFQELMCSCFIQPRDKVLFPSNYTREFYIRLFEHINYENSFVCYPILGSFPNIKKRTRGRFIGFLGRASREKNFHQLINIALELKEPVLVAGELKFPNSELPSNMRYLGTIPYNKVWNFLAKLRVLIFPSTANIESLGRVLLEANHLGIPTIAADFGASPELSQNLVPVSFPHREIELVHNHPMACIDESVLLEKLNDTKGLKLGSNNAYKDHEEKFKHILKNTQPSEYEYKLTASVRDFIANSKIYINQEYSMNCIDAIEVSIKLLKKEDITNIGWAAHNISEPLSFIPKWNLC